MFVITYQMLLHHFKGLRGGYTMKSNKILMAGALALSMVLSGGMLTGCSNSSTKDTKTTEVAKKKEVKTLGKRQRIQNLWNSQTTLERKSQYLKQSQVQKKTSVITCWKMETL